MNDRNKHHYLFTIDLMKGFVLFPMIITHGLGWWDPSLVFQYENSSVFVIILTVSGLMVFPCYLFIYGFNQVNSFLRKDKNSSNRDIMRIQAIRRCIIFSILALSTMALYSITNDGNLGVLINYIFTWYIIHVFAFSTIFILFLWELASYVEKRFYHGKNQQILTMTLSLSLMFIIVLFGVFYSFMNSQNATFPVSLDIESILIRIIIDLPSYGLIPWLSFPLFGGLTASFLNLHNISDKNIKLRSFGLLLLNILILFTGLGFLTKERFVSPALGYSSSLSFVFVSCGSIGCVFIGIFLLFDIYQLISSQKLKKMFYPIITVSKITFTIFIIHPIIAVIDPRIIPSEQWMIILGIMYSILFVIIAMIWQRWDFKYSFEWAIKKFTKMPSSASENHKGSI